MVESIGGTLEPLICKWWHYSAPYMQMSSAHNMQMSVDPTTADPTSADPMIFFLLFTEFEFGADLNTVQISTRCRSQCGADPNAVHILWFFFTEFESTADPNEVVQIRFDTEQIRYDRYGADPNEAQIKTQMRGNFLFYTQQYHWQYIFFILLNWQQEKTTFRL